MSDRFCVLQDDLKDCGVCSLLSIIKYYNGNVSREYLRECTKTTNDGVNALNLLKCARKLGFEAYGIKGKINEINCNLLPFIAHVIIDKKYPHFVVIYKIYPNKSKILVMDPAKGFTYYKMDKFVDISTGYYLILKPKQPIPNLDFKSNFWPKIKENMIRYKKILLFIIIISLFYILINIIGSYHFKLMYTSIDDNLNLIMILLCIILFIKSMFHYLRTYLLILFNTILDKFITKNAFNHIINLPYLYYRNHTNGDLLTRINDLGNVKELLSNLIISVLVDLLLAIIILFFMFKISFKLSILTIICLFIYGIITIINSKYIKRIIQDTYEKSSLVNNSLVESLSSFETIKNLSIQNYVYKSFSDRYDDYCIHNKLLAKVLQNESFFKNITLELGNLIIIYLGVKMISNSELSIVSLITFISLSNYLIDPIRKLMDLNIQYQNAKESIRRVRELYNVSPEITNTSNRSIKYLHGDIDIDSVNYSYNGTNNILSNISFEIKEGEKVLIYGESGCGKSTLMQLLIKYLDSNYQGNITIGGYDLKDIDLYSLRKNICYVSQNEYLYTNTIYENITLGRKIRYSKFLDIVRSLFVDKIIANSVMGYNYMLENNGENISGGERKRIIIARSILQKANIYIYDETFSEMDITLERKILEYLFKLYPSKTFIIISHRFSNQDLFNKKIKIGGESVEFIK